MISGRIRLLLFVVLGLALVVLVAASFVIAFGAIITASSINWQTITKACARSAPDPDGSCLGAVAANAVSAKR